MSQHQDSATNSSIFSTAEYTELRKKIALSSSDLIELTYNEEKFNSKLDELNSLACTLIADDKPQQAAVYLDEAEKILEYAAGCGKTIERTLITTILNNQACLLQRNSDFEQSANYLEAIIYNINEYVEGYQEFEIVPALNNPLTAEFAEMATYFERKLALALYHLRFCALSSHSKNNEVALKAARKALQILKSVCREQYLFETYKQKHNPSSSNILDTIHSKPQEISKTKAILRDLANLKPISETEAGQFELYLKKAIHSIYWYQKKIGSYMGAPSDLFSKLENYSIGNLMQASPTQLSCQPDHNLFITEELSTKGKLYKIIHLAMAHFTIATELRLISAHKYSLDENERHASPEFKESKLCHLLSIIIISRYLPSKSVFFDHSVTSFRNHYGISLLEEVQNYEPHEEDGSFSVILHEEPSQLEERGQISRLQEEHTFEEDNIINNSIQIHDSEDIKANELAYNMMNRQYSVAPPPKMTQTLMKELNNRKLEQKKIKLLKSKSKSKHGAISFSRALEGVKQLAGPSKNKENKSRAKLVSFKGKETIKSRNKLFKTEHEEDNKKGIYYGHPEKSSSKSKKLITQRKYSKRGLETARTGLAFQNKRLLNEVKIDEEYGVKSSGQFGLASEGKIHKPKTLRHSHGVQEDHIYPAKSSSKHSDHIKMKKLKSPPRIDKYKPGVTKRKSVSKDKYF